MSGSRLLRVGVVVGAFLWLLRPLYFLAEIVTSAATRGGYSFLEDTVSDLGVVSCVTGASGAELCSPRHALMNTAFVVFGVAMALGAVLVASGLGRGWRDGAVRGVVGALVVAGVSSAAVGLVPLDRDPTLHYAVALPVFVAQPIGLLLLAWVLRRRTTGVAVLLVVAAVASVVGAAWFGFGGDDLSGRGAIERLALWPTFVALALVGGVLVREERARPDPV